MFCGLCTEKGHFTTQDKVDTAKWSKVKFVVMRVCIITTIAVLQEAKKSHTLHRELVATIVVSEYNSPSETYDSVFIVSIKPVEKL